MILTTLVNSIKRQFHHKEEYIIFSKFLKLNSEKQQRILNAAMKEFAQKGYSNASTDAIVKDADISKGALFYYFKNKKELFLFIYDYALDTVTNEILMKFDANEKDVFERRRLVAKLKIEILKVHPEMYDFLAVAYMEDTGDVKVELESRNTKAIAGGQSKLNEGIDTTKFKEDVDVKRAIEIITWTLDGFAKKEMEKIKNLSLEEVDFDKLYKEMDVYLEVLKKSFYK